MTWLKHSVKPERVTPALLSITDIAGLGPSPPCLSRPDPLPAPVCVPALSHPLSGNPFLPSFRPCSVRGASEGKGLGNEFLSHVSAVDAIFHLVRVFPNPETPGAGRTIEHVEGSVDPTRDMDIIARELVLKDVQRVKERHDKAAKLASRAPAGPHAAHAATLKKALDYLAKDVFIAEGDWTPADAEVLSELGLITAKPMVYLLNATAEDFLKGSNKWLGPVREWIARRSPGAPSLLFSGDWEADVRAVHS